MNSDADSPLTLPSCGRRNIPRIAQSMHYLQISNVIAKKNMDSFFVTLNVETSASSLLRSSTPGIENGGHCYEVESPAQLSELIMSITQVAAEHALEIVDKCSSDSAQQDGTSTSNAPRVTSTNIFRPAKKDSPEVYALCDSSKDKRNPIPKVVVVCLPPWRYKASDLKDFVNRTSLRHEPVSRTPPGTPPPTNGDIIWALTCDACFAAECTYFVVSTYNGWVFGNRDRWIPGVKNRWEVSPIMKFDNLNPSVPKMLLQHFMGAFSNPLPPPKFISMSGTPMPFSDADEEDEDGYPLQLQDVMSMDGFQERFLKLYHCQ